MSRNKGNRRKRVTRVNTVLVFVVVVIAGFAVYGALGNTIINRTLTGNSGLENGLVGHWTFDGGDMDWASTTAEAIDRSTSANHGNVGNFTSSSAVGGVIGQALEFDGNGDEIDVGNQSELNFGATDFSLNFWVKFSSFGSNQYIIEKKAGVLDSAQGYRLTYVSSSDVFSMNVVDGAEHTANVSSNTLGWNTGEWHHVVVNVDRLNNVQYYFDNVTAGSGSISSVLSFTSSGSFMIGGSDYTSASLSGGIDNVMAHNRLLTTREISRLYDLGNTTHVNKTLTANPNLEDGLVAHWTFDGKDMQPDVRDISGQGNHGDIEDQTPTTTVPGVIGQALEFDNLNDRIMGLTPDNFEYTGGDLSASFWVKPYDTDLISRLISKPWNGSGEYNYSLRTASDNSLVLLLDGAGASVATTTSADVLVDNTWNHVVLSLTSDDEVFIYVNNVLEKSGVHSITSWTPDSGDSNVSLTLGALYPYSAPWAGNANHTLDGAMDDVRVYDRVLSPEEVSRLYELGNTTHINKTLTANPNLERGLEAHYTFDGKDMTPKVQDRSGNGNHGTLGGQTSTTTAIGRIGQALEFDGSDDYINLGTAPGFYTNLEGTIAFWTKFDTVTSGSQQVFGYDDFDFTYFNIKLVGDGSNRYIQYNMDDGGSGFDQLSGAHDLDSGEWYHLVITSDSSTIKAYKNGGPIGLEVANGGNTGDWIGDGYAQGLDYRIGNQHDDIGPDFAHYDGILDDIRFYDRPLSLREIQQLYNLGAPRKIYTNTLPTPSDAGRNPTHMSDRGGGTGTQKLYMDEWLDPEGDDLEYYFEYFAATQTCGGSPSGNSGWITDPTTSGGYTIPVVDQEYNAWRVKARDGVGSETDWNSCYWFDNFGGGSCPFLYVWNGESFDLETDIYGSGKVGAKSKLGYIQPNPHDYYILDNVPVIKDGVYEMRLVEERMEINYLDEIRLYTVDIPENRDIYAEMPMFGGSYEGFEQELHTVNKNLKIPTSAVHANTGTDALERIWESDGEYFVLNEDKNVGFEYQTLELDLGDLSSAEQVKLIVDAISVFPDSPEGIEHKLKFGPRVKMEVQDADGNWVSIPKEVAELPLPKALRRPFVIDISDIFQSDEYKIRLTFLFKTYIDSILLDTTLDSEVVVTEVPLISSDLRSYGVSDKEQVFEDIYEYTYEEESPNHAHSYMPGRYTKFGDVSPLLSVRDDKFVIFGNGDELAMEFGQPVGSGSGMNREYMLYSVGYYKDTTIDIPHSVDPLPFSGMNAYPYDTTVENYPQDREHTLYIEEWNTRYYPEPEEGAGSDLLGPFKKLLISH